MTTKMMPPSAPVLLDDAGNATVTGAYKIVLSDKKLVKVSGTKTVTAQASRVSAYASPCSRVIAPGRHKWAGSIGYLANYYGCGGVSDQVDVVHSTFLPHAVKYGSVHVGTYGGAGRPHHFLDIASLSYVFPDGVASETGRMLKPAVQRYTGPTVGAAYVSKSGRFTWGVTTEFGAWYDVKNFTLHYTYYVLC